MSLLQCSPLSALGSLAIPFSGSMGFLVSSLLGAPGSFVFFAFPCLLCPPWFLFLILWCFFLSFGSFGALFVLFGFLVCLGLLVLSGSSRLLVFRLLGLLVLSCSLGFSFGVFVFWCFLGLF